MIVQRRDLGECAYLPCWQAMQAFTATRVPGDTDELWLCSHPAVFTLGRAGKAEHVLAPGDIPVVRSDRGGQVTFTVRASSWSTPCSTCAGWVSARGSWYAGSSRA